MTRRLQGYHQSRRGVTSCPPGTIVRNAYVRKRFGRKSLVPASCIRDLGNPGKGFPGKGPGIGPLRKGVLQRYGYAKVKTLTVAARREALAKAVKADGSLTVWRHLNALFVYMKRTAPTSSKIFKADRDWIHDTYGIKAF